MAVTFSFASLKVCSSNLNAAAIVVGISQFGLTRRRADMLFARCEFIMVIHSMAEPWYSSTRLTSHVRHGSDRSKGEEARRAEKKLVIIK